MAFGKDKQSNASELGRKGAIKRNKLYGSPFADPKLKEKLKKLNTSEQGRKGGLASIKKCGTPFEKLWKENRKLMMKHSRHGIDLSHTPENIIKCNKAAFKKNHLGPKGEKMYSIEEVRFAEEVKSRGLDYEYEPYIGLLISPDFKINGKIIEVAGVHLNNYWKRMTEKVELYESNKMEFMIYNQTRPTFQVPVKIRNLTRDIEKIFKFVR